MDCSKQPRVLAVASITATVLGLAGAPTAVADAGFRGFSYRDANRVEIPTADKPQSKLWFQDGSWWGVLYSPLTGSTRIHRLEPSTQSWIDAGTTVDQRPNARADVLWDGGKLYVVSATTVVSEWGNPPLDADVNAGSAQLSRFSYDAAGRSYSLDPGFPVTVHDGSTESITLAKDSMGKLWATFTQNSQVWVNRSLGTDSQWGQPFLLPVTGAAAHYDDISAVTAFQRDKIGVMWSNQSTRKFYFATHRDGDPDGTWQSEIAYGGGVGGCSSGCANDHLNVKQLTSDGTGRVFAAIKTANRNTGQPFVMLIVRDAQGTWRSHVFGVVEDLHTRPMIMIDEEHRRLFMFAVAPEVGGGIYFKQTSLDAISFPPGVGTPFIQGSQDGDISNPTTTKQNVNSATGLVVLASANRNAYYWHNSMSLADLPQPPPVAPANAGVSLPASRPESRLKLSWSDNSVNESGFTVERKTGAGTFRQIASTAAGSTSYTDSGLAQDTTYSYRVQAFNASGKSPYSDEASGTTARVLTFTPFADAYVDAAASSSNFGPSPSLRLDATPVQEGFLQFRLAGLTGLTVRSAHLRMYVSDDGSAKGGTVARTSDVGWQENSVTYGTRPAIDGPTLASLGTVTPGQWYQLSVTPAVTGDGSLGFGLRTSSGDGVGYASREDSSHPPQLVVTVTR
jgi:hypothetical protein